MDIENQKEKFKNHKATLTDYGDIKILDFKNPESFDYFIRFIFDEKCYRLHISGDLGELSASNYCNMTYEKFEDFVNDIGYFESKIECHSRPLYIYEEYTAKEQLIKFLDDNGIETDDKDKREILVYEIMNCFDEDKGLSDKGISIITQYHCDDYEVYCFAAKMGLVSTGILDLYMLAFKLAKKRLKIEKPKFCEYCFNARICPPSDDPFETELTDENDFSSCNLAQINISDGERYCVMLSSGAGKRPRLEFNVWQNTSKNPHWATALRYYPKFCPECGRRLNEYGI